MLKTLEDFLNSDNAVTTLMGEVEKKTKVTKKVQLLATGSLVLFYLILGQASEFLSNIIILGIPFYASVRSLEPPRYSADGSQWLEYWIVFSCLSFVEVFAYWVPAYRLLKVSLLVCCMIPGKPNGAHVVYHYLIRPLAMRHAGTVELAISHVAQSVRKRAEKAAEDHGAAPGTNLPTRLLLAIKQVGRFHSPSNEHGSDTAATKNAE